MKLDPNLHCTRYRENKLWAICHDLVAHPLMAASNYKPWSIKFHDLTSQRAWPRTSNGAPASGSNQGLR